MKKISTIVLSLISLLSAAQPIIQSTYLPVRGTSIKEVWDTVNNYSAVPSIGANQIWDYSNKFTHPVDTFQIKTFHPDSTLARYHQHFPSATHASYIRTPFNNLSDSLYSYYIVDTNGLHMIGGFNIRKPIGNYIGYDTTAAINPSELLSPALAAFGMHRIDSSKYVTFGNLYANPVKVKGKKYKDMNGVGYGTLKMPNGTIYNNVLLTKVNVTSVDSVFFSNSGSFAGVLPQSYIEYSFLRNNTFGGTVLMFLTVNASNSYVDYGWYTLPVDFGSISGTVYKSLNETPGNLVISGEALLYRENSNFARNDILERTPLKANGTYRFDSIPYGEYRIAIRPDTILYPHAFTTYHGDSTNWLLAPAIHSSTDSTWNSPIHLKYQDTLQGLGVISGHLGLNLHERSINPIPGVDVIVKKNPGGIAVREVKSDSSNSSSNFTIKHLHDGTYYLFVDIPGLHMADSCYFTILGGTVINGLDFTVGSDSIHPACQHITNVNEHYQTNNLMEAYPNPYSLNTTIKVNLTEKNDVLIEVYNVLGEKIQTIDKGQKQIGTYSYNFSAKNLNYPAGVYIVKLTSGNKISILKIIEQ